MCIVCNRNHMRNKFARHKMKMREGEREREGEGERGKKKEKKKIYLNEIENHSLANRYGCMPKVQYRKKNRVSEREKECEAKRHTARTHWQNMQVTGQNRTVSMVYNSSVHLNWTAFLDQDTYFFKNSVAVRNHTKIINLARCPKKKNFFNL